MPFSGHIADRLRYAIASFKRENFNGCREALLVYHLYCGTMRVPTDRSHNHPTQKCALGEERGEFPSLSLAWRRVARKIDHLDQVEYDRVCEQDHSEVRVSRFYYRSLDLKLQTSEC